jgi:hypothetical protein
MFDKWTPYDKLSLIPWHPELAQVFRKHAKVLNIRCHGTDTGLHSIIIPSGNDVHHEVLLCVNVYTNFIRPDVGAHGMRPSSDSRRAHAMSPYVYLRPLCIEIGITKGSVD